MFAYECVSLRRWWQPSHPNWRLSLEDPELGEEQREERLSSGKDTSSPSPFGTVQVAVLQEQALSEGRGPEGTLPSGVATKPGLLGGQLGARQAMPLWGQEAVSETALGSLALNPPCEGFWPWHRSTKNRQNRVDQEFGKKYYLYFYEFLTEIELFIQNKCRQQTTKVLTSAVPVSLSSIGNRYFYITIQLSHLS